MRSGIAIWFVSLFCSVAQAGYTATPPAALVEAVAGREFRFVGSGKFYGFHSAESCLWVAQDMAILENYCVPRRAFAARGIMVWARDIGIVELYEEKVAGGRVMREWSQREFPEIVGPLFPGNWADLDVARAKEILEKVSRQYNPSCWSSNFSWSEEVPVFGCHRADAQEFESWGMATQDLVKDPAAWNSTWVNLLAKIKGKLDDK